MNILIIGGTVFLGRALVEAALQAGHEVTLFNRGISAPAAFPAVETIVGDREYDLARLTGRRWDAVIDTCGYLPRLVRLSAEALRESVDRYTFISTLSVYPPAGAPQRDESAPVLTLDEESVEEVTAETYGPLKTHCERALQASFPGPCLSIRSGLIVGPHDPTNRFTYWVRRATGGGEAIAPPADQPVQFIDVQDLASFTLRLTEQGDGGVYNVTGPAQPLKFGVLVSAAKEALKTDVRFHHVSDGFLREQEIGEFMELPLWLNAELANSFMTFDIGKALANGLDFRPLERTLQDTWHWARSLPDDIEKPADLPPAREATLLKAWKRYKDAT